MSREDQPARRRQRSLTLLGVDPARRRLGQRPRDARLGGGPREPDAAAERAHLLVLGAATGGDPRQNRLDVRPLRLHQIGQRLARGHIGPGRPQRIRQQAERAADQRVEQPRPCGRERVRGDRVQQEHDDRGDEREPDREVRGEHRVGRPREHADQHDGRSSGWMQRDRDRSRQADAECCSAGALGAAGERGAELGAQGGRGRHHHPIAPAQRQVPRDQLGEQHDHREPHRVAPRRRVEAGVGTKH